MRFDGKVGIVAGAAYVCDGGLTLFSGVEL